MKFQVFRKKKNGTSYKKVVFECEAQDEKEAYAKFGKSGRWGMYHENTFFEFRAVAPNPPSS